MSGHSKWSTIKRKKEASDSKRAKIFTKISREMAVAVRESGADPSTNAKLRDVIAKAKANNVPNDNITRLLQKLSGSSDGANYETITYEGYGPSGIAVIVETMTDNRNRTASEMRHAFDKNGGNLGASGCVSWQFDKKGVIIIENDGSMNEDDVMMAALEAGASDFEAEDGLFEIYTEPDSLGVVRDALEKAGYSFADAEVQMVPQTYSTLSSEEDIKNMLRLIDMLEDNDDVQNIWHNWENDEE